ncbi:MAG: FAD-binding oxidoreductase [Gammaproteobacteria bacterium]|mgnify:FL=1|tara:strand:+ start:4678 stop:6054 length:1377 start_codon:yes stop_codon:yes gene_type:complete
MTLLEEIEKIVGDNGIIFGEDVFNRKAGIWIDDGIRADAIVRPKNTEELSKVLSICNQLNQEVIPHGGLTGLAEGAISKKGQIAISSERMKDIEEIDEIGRTITVQAGVPLERVQEEAEKYNLMLAVDLGARGSCTIGGNISTNAGGNMVIKYGMMRDSVLGLEAVLADGKVVTSMNQMLKNNSGYDLKQLFIGTEGTLGFVTKAVLRLREKPKSINTALLGLDSFAQVIKLLKYLDKGLGGNLSAYEVMWKNYYEVVVQSNSSNTPPLPVNSNYFVLVETLGADQEKDTSLFEELLEEALQNKIIKDAVIPQSEPERSRLWAIRDDVEQHYKEGPVKMFDVSMPILSMEDYVKEVNKRFAENWDTYKCVVFGHVGDGNLHIIGGVGSENKEEIIAMESCIYEPLEDINGAISAEHGIGLEKKNYLGISRSVNEINLMKTLKKALDPNNILNPGKVFD